MLNELLNRINSVLLGHRVEDLEDWLVGHLQDILDSGDKKAIDVANRVDADLISYSENLIDFSKLIENLQRHYYSAQTIFKEYGQSISIGIVTIAGATPVAEVQYRQSVEV
jgi:hypothetical protein